MDDKELQAKVKWLTQNCSFLVKRDILVEELAELLNETNSPRLHINKWSNDKIIEEFSDVYLMLWQICIYLGEDTIEDYIVNYEDKESMVFSKESMTFLQKATQAIWLISKIRREQDVVKNFYEFRAVIYLLVDHIYDNLIDLNNTKSNNILKKIRETVIAKVLRQEKRIESEKAIETYATHDLDIINGLVKELNDGSDSAETSD